MLSRSRDDSVIGISHLMYSEAKAIISKKKQQSLIFANREMFRILWLGQCLCFVCVQEWLQSGLDFVLTLLMGVSSKSCLSGATFRLLSYTTSVTGTHVWIRAKVLWLNRGIDGIVSPATTIKIGTHGVQRLIFQQTLPWWDLCVQFSQVYHQGRPFSGRQRLFSEDL